MLSSVERPYMCCRTVGERLESIDVSNADSWREALEVLHIQQRMSYVNCDAWAGGCHFSSGAGGAGSTSPAQCKQRRGLQLSSLDAVQVQMGVSLMPLILCKQSHARMSATQAVDCQVLLLQRRQC